MNVENLLFIDTETNEDTQAIDCITYLIGDKMGIIEEFNDDTYNFLRDLWHFSEGVVFYNAPFDMGVLSKAYKYNGFEWREDINEDTETKSSYWDMLLFGHRYKVKKLSYSANFIYPMGRKNIVPIIDLLKLWGLLIETRNEKVSIRLKSLITRHLNWENGAIEYTKENAKLDAYRYQDVIAPKELMYIFLDKIKDINKLNDFSAVEWGSIKSSATFSKIFYKKEYEDLKQYQEDNDKEISKFKLSSSLEKAYHGGMTFAFYRGNIFNCAWIDIKGAYANAMVHMNTDRYLRFKIEKVNSFDLESPYLLYIKSNFVIDTIEGGLKTYYVKEPYNNWIWNYDIAAIENLIDDFKYEIIEIYKFIPDLDVKDSLPKVWNNYKNIEEKENGKSTLYNFYKLLSNSSYGIKAQRIPSRTHHTNMVIAGMITSRAHLILTTINKIIRNQGYTLLYNDTDSACFHFDNKQSDDPLNPNYNNDPFDLTLIDKVNKAIFPYEVDYEGIYRDNRFLSLKRYVCSHATDFEYTNKKMIGYVPNDKIKVHGKGQYDLTFDDMYYAVYPPETPRDDRKLNIKQFSGTTKRTLKRIMVKFPNFKSELRPFMFVTNIKSDTYISSYLGKWVNHIDKKLTIKEGKVSDFYRTFRKFNNRNAALLFYKNSLKKERSVYGSNMSDSFIFYDAMEKELSDESIIAINNIEITTVQTPAYIDPIVEKYCSKCNCGLVIGKNILESRVKKHVYICNKCFSDQKNRTSTDLTNEKKVTQTRILKAINKGNLRKEKIDKNKSQEEIMLEHDKEMQDNNKQIKEIRKRLEDKENNYLKKMVIQKKKQQNKKPSQTRKIKKDEKKFCKKCNVLLNPYVAGNITMAKYKQSKYICLDCNKEILKQKHEQQQIIKNNR